MRGQWWKTVWEFGGRNRRLEHGANWPQLKDHNLIPFRGSEVGVHLRNRQELQSSVPAPVPREGNPS